MTKNIKILLTSKEVQDAIREYCVNTTGIINEKTKLRGIKVGGADYDAPGNPLAHCSVEVEFTES